MLTDEIIMYVLFSRSLRDGAGSFDDDRQTNALFGCKESVGWLELSAQM